MNLRSIVALLKKHANPKNAAGMARFGINPKNTLGEMGGQGRAAGIIK